MRLLVLALLLPLGLFLLVFLADSAVAQESTTKEAKKQKTEKAKRALNKAFTGRVIRIKKKTVTIYYDFEDEAQLKDFPSSRIQRFKNRVASPDPTLLMIS